MGKRSQQTAQQRRYTDRNKHVKAPHPVSSGKYRLKQQQDITTHLLGMAETKT